MYMYVCMYMNIYCTRDELIHVVLPGSTGFAGFDRFLRVGRLFEPEFL